MLSIRRMKYIGYLLLLLLCTNFACAQDSKYYTISVEATATFPRKGLSSSYSIVRVDRTSEQANIYSIKNDSVCSKRTYQIKDDSIVGDWDAIANYTYRLLFPELSMKSVEKARFYINTGLIEEKGNQNWKICEERHLSKLSGTITFDEDRITLDTQSEYNTSARGFLNTYRATIEEINDFEVLKFDIKWDAMCEN